MVDSGQVSCTALSWVILGCAYCIEHSKVHGPSCSWRLPASSLAGSPFRFTAIPRLQEAWETIWMGPLHNCLGLSMPCWHKNAGLHQCWATQRYSADASHGPCTQLLPTHCACRHMQGMCQGEAGPCFPAGWRRQVADEGANQPVAPNAGMEPRTQIPKTISRRKRCGAPTPPCLIGMLVCVLGKMCLISWRVLHGVHSAGGVQQGLELLALTNCHSRGHRICSRSLCLQARKHHMLPSVNAHTMRWNNVKSAHVGIHSIATPGMQMCSTAACALTDAVRGDTNTQSGPGPAVFSTVQKTTWSHDEGVPAWTAQLSTHPNASQRPRPPPCHAAAQGAAEAACSGCPCASVANSRVTIYVLQRPAHPQCPAGVQFKWPHRPCRWLAGIAWCADQALLVKFLCWGPSSSCLATHGMQHSCRNTQPPPAAACSSHLLPPDSTCSWHMVPPTAVTCCHLM